jgi:hypothetical protein
MPQAILINDRGTERDYQIPNGNIITLVFDEFDYEITFKQNGKPLEGEFCFKDEYDSGSSFLLRRMYSPIPQSGLGRAALEFFIDMTGASVYTRENDGETRDDGSHLTEDATIFVPRMQAEGLIEPWDNL